MAYVQVRRGAKGTRYTGIYIETSGRERSAGTYATEEEALRRAKETEKQEREGRHGGMTSAQMGTVTIAEYAEDFLYGHNCAPVTKRNYQSVLANHVVPHLGKRRVAELTVQEAAAWLTDLKKAGMTPSMERRCKVTLSAMMSRAKLHGIRKDNPVQGVKTSRQSRTNILVMTKGQFTKVHAELPTLAAKMMALLVVKTGLRFGEVTALLVRDIDFNTNTIYVTKAVSDVGAEWHPNGQDRFIVNPYTKNGEIRQFALKPETVRAIAAYVRTSNLAPDDLMFPLSLVASTERRFPSALGRAPLTPERLAELGTFIAPNGLEYQHGSMNGYVTGKCKCDGCRQAISEYSAERRTARAARKGTTRSARAAAGKAPASRNSLGHVPKETWGRMWKAAVKRSGMSWVPTAYQLRHTCASWMIWYEGKTVEDVRSQLGHESLTITARYITRVDAEPVDPALLDVDEDFDLDGMDVGDLL